MNRLLDELSGRAARDGDIGVSTAWMPPADTYETADGVVLEVELPGLSRDDFSLEVRQDMLVLQGERRQRTEVKEEGYHRRERAYGHFERSFLLPATLDRDGVQATYKDGVLEVRLPKIEVARPKRIAIAW
jgi:HSP20 family protein